ncbi:DUF3052 domain-containing protein [Ichthyenterobacterium sp. W332]|uniref:DUF3052 domain-containing protein n=1 Tax=Microcosmobacter mediterraneus TaxID=3075607 RepID=A0ABU2YL39_9FLAO|nr:DUF3052 domain-containing protein [Ichthyenterobacterium sp. W332]MDT0558877.1 DUF3052 domain-containing protein [Ichthyenterobacterium sp. W332]
MASGYSKTPLEKKLGLKDNFKILLYNQPKYYFSLFNEIPNGIEQLEDINDKSADFIHIFCKNFKDLEAKANFYKTALKYSGAFWVSWPKASSKIVTDLKREPVRDFLLSIGS